MTSTPLTRHEFAVSAVACTVLDGKPVAVTGSWDGTVCVWDLATGQPIDNPLTGHEGSVDVVACTVLDGKPVAVTGGHDGTARVWDLRAGRLLRTFVAANFRAAAFAADGQLVLGLERDIAVLRCVKY
ncbi:WD40 repeat domain-containing protein [Streptomyces mirabilis]